MCALRIYCFRSGTFSMNSSTSLRWASGVSEEVTIFARRLHRQVGHPAAKLLERELLLALDLVAGALEERLGLGARLAR